MLYRNLHGYGDGGGADRGLARWTPRCCSAAATRPCRPSSWPRLPPPCPPSTSSPGPCSPETGAATAWAPARIAAATGRSTGRARSTPGKSPRSGRTLCPTAGTCMVMGTASTMACVAEALGLMLPGAANPARGLKPALAARSRHRPPRRGPGRRGTPGAGTSCRRRPLPTRSRCWPR